MKSGNRSVAHAGHVNYISKNIRTSAQINWTYVKVLRRISMQVQALI